MTAWNPQAALDFFDANAESEWRRFEDGRSGPAAAMTHAHYLRRFVRKGDRVLDAGSGPGRFAIELAAIGAHVVLADISPKQLELSREKLRDAEAEHAIEARVVADITDLSMFEDSSFDATVCYGGAISYVADRGEQAVAELARVTRPGGHLLVSVMCLVGATVEFIQDVLDIAREQGIETVDRVVESGLLPRSAGGHFDLRMYRWRELEEMLARQGEIVAAAATGMFRQAPQEPELRELLERIELELGAEPGAIETGQHMLAVVRV
jgi:SAM-dependent methyltransferase